MADKTTISTLLQSASNFVKMQNYISALSAYDSILSIDPHNVEAFLGKGVALSRLGRYDEALTWIEWALSYNLKNAFVWNEKGVALSKLGRNSEAIDAFNHAIEIDSSNITFKNNKDFAFKKLIEQNRLELEKSDKSGAHDWNEKGIGYFKQKKYAEALNAFSEALKLNPSDTTIKNNRENAQKKLEKPKTKPFRVSSVIGLIVLFVIVFIFVTIVGGFVIGLIHPQTSQSLPLSTTPQPTANIPLVLLSTTQPTLTISLSQLLQEAENKKANSIAQAIDYKNPIVKNFANRQVQRSSSGNYSIAQICDIWKSIYNQWIYVPDRPDFNYFTSASDSISNGLKGNCLDYAILNAAVIEAIGGSSRVVTACPPNGGECHAYAEVLLAKNQDELQAAADYICTRYNCKSIYYHTYSRGITTTYWLNLDWSAGYPGGTLFNDDGKYYVYYPNGFHEMLTHTTAYPQ